METSQQQDKKRRRKDERGFTLIEIMVVVFIIGLIAALVAPSVWKRWGTAQKKTAMAQMSSIHAALDLYRLDNHRYPDSLEGLVQGSGETWDGPYLEDGKIPKDPWGNEYVYSVVEGGKSFKLLCTNNDDEPIVHK